MEDESTDAPPTPDPRDDRGRFKPGFSGNPSGRNGRKSGLAQRVQALTGDGEEILNYLRAVATGAERASTRDRLMASDMLLNRGYGRPMGVDVTVESKIHQVPDEVAEMADTALQELARLFNEQPATSKKADKQ